MKSFRYQRLSFKHLPLLHSWCSLPHVMKWYSKKPLSYTELEKKYTPYILGSKGICGFICYFNNKPFGYIQYYPVKRYPWSNHGLADKLNVCAGVDAFIGEKSFMGQGLGKLMITRFIQRHLWRNYSYCAVDPHIRNHKAIHCYSACGFSVHQKVLSDDQEEHYLMLKAHL